MALSGKSVARTLASIKRRILSQMATRLKAELWIKAQVRICEAQGAQAFVVRRGDETAGAIIVKVNSLDGKAVLLEPATTADGARAWMRVTGSEPVAEADADAAIGRAIKRDPDLWVLEVEDRQGRHFLTEPVL
jgi:hypothetical protein